ncbi:MAG: PilZ domain-containing protein, partial [Terriglobales bacterium]
WLTSHLPENEPDDPPVPCQLKDLSGGACYLITSSPFPKFSRVILSVPNTTPAVRAGGVVRLAHPEFGMGVEFLQSTPEQKDEARRIVETLRKGVETLQVHVEPNGLETGHEEKPRAAHSPAEDALIHLFRQQARASVEVFLERLEQRQPQESR